jgi:hypothetical protein
LLACRGSVAVDLNDGMSLLLLAVHVHAVLSLPCHASPAAAGLLESWLDLLLLQQQLGQCGLQALSQLLQAIKQLWMLWEACASRRTHPAQLEELRIAQCAVGMAQPTLQMVQHCLYTLLTAAAAFRDSSSSSSLTGTSDGSSSSSSLPGTGDGSSSSSNSAAVGVSLVQMGPDELEQAVSRAVKLQATVLQTLHRVDVLYCWCPEGFVDSLPPAAMQQLQQCMMGKEVETAVLQRLAAFKQLLLQQQPSSSSGSSRSRRGSSGSTGSSSSSSLQAGQPPQQPAAAAAAAARAAHSSAAAVQCSPPWLLPAWNAYVAAVDTWCGGSSSLIDKSNQLDKAGCLIAAIVLCVLTNMHVEAYCAAASGVHHIEVLHESSVVSAAAIRSVMEVQLLLAERLHALQQQQQQLPNDLQHHSAYMVLHAWWALCRAARQQIQAAAVAGQGGSLQQLRQPACCACVSGQVRMGQWAVGSCRILCRRAAAAAEGCL